MLTLHYMLTFCFVLNTKKFCTFFTIHDATKGVAKIGMSKIK